MTLPKLPQANAPDDGPAYDDPARSRRNLMKPCRETGERPETQRQSCGDYSATLGSITQLGREGFPLSEN